MSVSSDDNNLLFVTLLSENKEILHKSQVPSVKKQKEAAIIIFIEKWATISGKELSQAALLKKINNLKTRAKAAFNKGAPLTDWQSKILEMKVKFSYFVTELGSVL